MIVLHLSLKKDGTEPLTVSPISADYGIGLLIYNPIQAVRSLIHKSLHKFEAVCMGDIPGTLPATLL